MKEADILEFEELPCTVFRNGIAVMPGDFVAMFKNRISWQWTVFSSGDKAEMLKLVNDAPEYLDPSPPMTVIHVTGTHTCAK